MADEGLFEELPEQKRPQPKGRGAPRLRVPERSQIDTHWASLDDLIPDDHPVRAVWAFVQGLDLSALHEAIEAREGQPGHPPAAPELLMALWLWATVDGVGSARRLDQLCRDHLVYRWLCGGVSMNYHSLSDFRIAHRVVLDQLLARGVASLVEAGLVSLDILAQDGLRVRASAGTGSFRRRKRLEELRTAAQARVARLRAELEADPGSGDKVRRAAQERAAREREARIAAAQERMVELEAERARREKTNKQEVIKQKEPRASTTDAEARVMKMADGGFRPAYNMQIVADPASQVIVAVDIDDRTVLERLERLDEIGQNECFHAQVARGLGEKAFLTGGEAGLKFVSKSFEKFQQMCLRAAHLRAGNQVQDTHGVFSFHPLPPRVPKCARSRPRCDPNSAIARV